MTQSWFSWPRQLHSRSPTCSLWRTFFSSGCCTDILNVWFYILLTKTKIGLKTFYRFPWALAVEDQLRNTLMFYGENLQVGTLCPPG